MHLVLVLTVFNIIATTTTDSWIRPLTTPIHNALTILSPTPSFAVMCVLV